MALSTSAIYTGNKTRVRGGCCDLIPSERSAQEPALNASLNYTKQCTVLNQNLISSPKCSGNVIHPRSQRVCFPPPTETPDLLAGSPPSGLGFSGSKSQSRVGGGSGLGRAARYLFIAATLAIAKSERFYYPPPGTESVND